MGCGKILVSLPTGHQNLSDATHLELHWGYADRAMSCTNDKGSSEYLDLVYSAHDSSVLYAGIWWITIGGILLSSAKLRRAVRSAVRRFLLRYSIRSICGRTTCLRVAVLLSLVAYALTPLSVMLANLESMLSLLTGVPYQRLNLLHHCLSYTIFVQSALHTMLQLVARQWVVETCLVCGIAAMTMLTLLIGLSTPWGIRLTRYETFRNLYYSLAMVYIGACWGHWDKLKCFILPSLIFWLIDRGCRLVGTGLLHYHIVLPGSVGFRICTAEITQFSEPEYGDAISQHHYLCFPESSFWQSHPFTPINAPRVETGLVKHSYIIRARHGETKKIAQLCASKLNSEVCPDIETTSVILTSLYGPHTMDNIEPHSNVICVVGGTGITYVFPVLLELVQFLRPIRAQFTLIWKVTSIEYAGVTDGRNRILSLHQSDGINGNWCPDFAKLIGEFLESTIDGPTIVFASVVAGFNSPSKVWGGQQRYDVKFIGEDRMEP
ncbi:hypothetical protein J3F84DRAFT_393861 [Trichoderma pleuroticola]